MSTTLVDEPIAAVIAKTSNAEEVLEECGIDYWFGTDKTLKAACDARKTDVHAIVRRLEIAERERPPVPLAQLLDEIERHFDAEIRPAAIRVRSIAGEPGGNMGAVLATLGAIEKILSRHLEIYRGYVLPALRARDAWKPGTASSQQTLDQRLVRELAMQHSILAVRARELVEAASAAAAGDPSGLVAASRKLSREIHHHLRVAYNEVMPELFAFAAMTRPVGCEPW